MFIGFSELDACAEHVGTQGSDQSEEGLLTQMHWLRQLPSVASECKDLPSCHGEGV